MLIGLFSLQGSTQSTSSINFTIKNLGINVNGHFNAFTIDTQFDSNKHLIGVSGKIEVSSIETGIKGRDNHLLEEGYFNSKTYKFITFQSRSITKKNASEYLIMAHLTIKGKTQKVSLPVTVKETQNGSYRITSNFEINRRNFNVGGRSFIMSKTVKIKVIHYQKN